MGSASLYWETNSTSISTCLQLVIRGGTGYSEGRDTRRDGILGGTGYSEGRDTRRDGIRRAADRGRGRIPEDAGLLKTKATACVVTP